MFISDNSITLKGTSIPKMLKLTCGKLWCLSACKKINFISLFFFEISGRHWKLAILRILEMLDNPPVKVILSICRKHAYLSACKKSTSPLTSFLRYCKKKQTYYFGYFGHTCLCTPKMRASNCRTFWCLSACQKQTSSFTSFLRYYIINTLAIWLVDSIFTHNSITTILPDMKKVMKYQFQY